MPNEKRKSFKVVHKDSGGKKRYVSKVRKNVSGSKTYVQKEHDREDGVKARHTETTYARGKKKGSNKKAKGKIKSLETVKGKKVVKTVKYSSNRKTGKDSSTTSRKPATKRAVKKLKK